IKRHGHQRNRPRPAYETGVRTQQARAMNAAETVIVPTQAEKAELFRALHEGPEPLLLPNPWDVGSAKLLTWLGFAALATTSSGFAEPTSHGFGRAQPGEEFR